MIAERLACQSNCFGNRVGRNVATPLLNDRFPSNARGHLLQDVGHQDSGPSERRLAMADCWIGYDVSPDHSLGYLMLFTMRHDQYLNEDYSQNKEPGARSHPHSS
jgi:hypothetical protein